LREVLRNALRFTRTGSPPSVEVREVKTEGFWRVQVADHGIGLDPAFWEKAFRMFWKLNASSDGLGSGLAISRRIVRRHGGDMRFIPAETGACVEIVLPVPSNPTEGQA
jgi:signal transduction histidine kinase